MCYNCSRSSTMLSPEYTNAMPATTKIPRVAKKRVLRGGTESTPTVAAPRELSEVEQRTITHKAAIDSACSGQWAQAIIHERLNVYPPPGMKLGDAKVLTPAWNAVETEQSNSGGVRGTRRWMPRQCHTIEDGLDKLKVSETWKVKHWPSAIRYDHMHAGRDAAIFDPRPHRHAASPIRVTRFVRLLDWPAHAVPVEPILISGVE